MRSIDNNKQAFLALLQAGLWEREVRLSQYEPIDFGIIHLLAQEQSVVGLVAAGLEYIVDINVSKEVALEFAGEALQLEHRNTSMNNFIGSIVKRMRGAGIYALLIKGQGIAQCYNRPLWRASGDVDLFLSEDNYNKAISYLRPLATNIEAEDNFKKHLALTIEPWEVELHGTLRCGLWKSLDKTMDKVHTEIFCGGSVRSWMDGNTQVFLPRADEDVVYVFAHILQHFFKGGVGVRQLCDWCRLLWTYNDKINSILLKSRLKEAGIMSEWAAFAAFAVTYLGMPGDAIPLYSQRTNLKFKSRIILSSIFETGNFGHNRDNSYYYKYPRFIIKIISFFRHCTDCLKHASVFPIDSIRVWNGVLSEGIKDVVKRNDNR